MFNRLIKQIVRKISPHQYFLIQLDITNACNLKCIHCYHPHHNNAGAINIEQWFHVLDQIKDLLTELYLEPEFTFCGGEPLLSQNFNVLIDKINEIWGKPKIGILTNGTLINEKSLTRMDPKQLVFQVSLDGPNKELHDKVRGNGNFEKAVEGIKLLIQNGYEVSCLSVLSNTSAQYIDDFFRLARSLKLKQMNFERFITQGEGGKLYANGVDEPLEGKNLKNAMQLIVESSKKFNVPTSTNSPLYCLIDDKLGHHNMVGLNGIVIDYKGNLRVTSRTSHVVGNVLAEGLKRLFFKDKLLADLRAGNIEVCGSCNYYTRCGGSRNASYAKYKNFLLKDPGCWYERD